MDALVLGSVLLIDDLSLRKSNYILNLYFLETIQVTICRYSGCPLYTSALADRQIAPFDYNKLPLRTIPPFQADDNPSFMKYTDLSKSYKDAHLLER